MDSAQSVVISYTLYPSALLLQLLMQPTVMKESASVVFDRNQQS